MGSVGCFGQIENIKRQSLNKYDGTFHFTNDEYEYIVPCAENKFNNKLIVKKNGKVVLQKEIKIENEDY